MHSLLTDIGIATLVGAAAGLIFHFLKQPLIVGYLFAGVIIGPTIGPKLVVDPENIEVISEIGLILLLFVIGLEINLQKVKALGKSLLLVGIGQFLTSLLIGFGFFAGLHYYFGSDYLTSVYLAIFCALSSTAVVVKLLYDKYELDTYAGRMTLGILIFQDIWAILVLALQPNLTDPKLSVIALALVKSLLLGAVGFLMSRFLLKRIFERIASSPDLVVAISIAWCAFVALLAGFLGLSIEMGGLIAGIAISTFPYSIHVTSKVLPLRDFFLTLFFISLGMKIPFPKGDMLTGALIIVLFVIISRFLTIYPFLIYSRLGRRNSFLTSINLAQISEFSLVIASLGLVYGHIGQQTVSIILYAMSATSVLSSYMIRGSHTLYQLWEFIHAKLGFKEMQNGEVETDEEDDRPIVILGYHRGAAAFVRDLEHNDPAMLSKIMVIDFNSNVLKHLKEKGIKPVFGDISHFDVLHHIGIGDARIILSTIPDMLLKGTSNVALVQNCRKLSPHAIIVATAESSHQELEIIEAGATHVLRPYSMIGSNLSEFVHKAI